MAAVALIKAATTAAMAQPVAVTASATEAGVSMRYIGVAYGYDRAAFRDLGFNTVFFGNSVDTWEPVNDTAYGALTPDMIKANPAVIPWAKWDATMGKEPWRSRFEATTADGVRIVIGLRNQYRNKNWSPNPMRTQDDWNEWWEHVFAVAYWMNVRNKYQVDDYQLLNEPNCVPAAGSSPLAFPCEGWNGTLPDYLNAMKRTRDALEAVYSKYLPGRRFNLMGPAVSYIEASAALPGLDAQGFELSGSWIKDSITNVGDVMTSVAFHEYGNAAKMISPSKVPLIYYYFSKAGRSLPLWMTEWGHKPVPGTVADGVDIITTLMVLSRPQTYVAGAHYFNLEGLYDKGAPASSHYHAFRMATRALQAGKTMFKTTVSSAAIQASVSRGPTGTLYALATNNTAAEVPFTLDLSALGAANTPTRVSRFDAANKDKTVDGPMLTGGRADFTLPGPGAILIQVGPGGDPTRGFGPGAPSLPPVGGGADAGQGSTKDAGAAPGPGTSPDAGAGADAAIAIDGGTVSDAETGTPVVPVTVVDAAPSSAPPRGTRDAGAKPADGAAPRRPGGGERSGCSFGPGSAPGGIVPPLLVAMALGVRRLRRRHPS